MWGKIWVFKTKWLLRYCDLKSEQNAHPVFWIAIAFLFSAKLHEICQELQKMQSSVQVRWFYWIDNIDNGGLWTILPPFLRIK